MKAEETHLFINIVTALPILAKLAWIWQVASKFRNLV